MGREHAPNGRDQTLEFDRFGIELFAPCGDGLLALALHRMRGHADDWDVPGLRTVVGSAARHVPRLSDAEDRKLRQELS